mmetsp:Transcript_16082/g.36789  ORF Transcript_16082/g.36789 Transcript_16082/m.36789 type:complete len:337 (+) Transcript_16082:152-1162(+)
MNYAKTAARVWALGGRKSERTLALDCLAWLISWDAARSLMARAIKALRAQELAGARPPFERTPAALLTRLAERHRGDHGSERRRRREGEGAKARRQREVAGEEGGRVEGGRERRLEMLWVGGGDERLDERVVVLLGGLREEVRGEVGERERQRRDRAREHVLGDPLGVGGRNDAALREDLARSGQRVDHLARGGSDARHLRLAQLGPRRRVARGDERAVDGEDVVGRERQLAVGVLDLDEGGLEGGLAVLVHDDAGRGGGAVEDDVARAERRHRDGLAGGGERKSFARKARRTIAALVIRFSFRTALVIRFSFRIARGWGRGARVCGLGWGRGRQR